jgi:glycerophosphoryl diester phosphodiesterase
MSSVLSNLEIMKTRLLLLLFVLISVSSAWAQCKFKAIGHRGSSYYYPENTLTAINQGFLEGMYAAQIDVRATSDSVLVLMHDSRVDRTTNGIGEINQMTYASVQALDAGSWKGALFAGEKVPTLNQALQVAYQYKKKLYLNMKIFNPWLIAKAMKQINLSDSFLIVNPNTKDMMIEYHTLLPKAKQVYCGPIPTDINDEAFYTTLKNNNVIAVEFSSDLIVTQKDQLQLYKEKVQAHGLEFWTYTVNEPNFIRTLKDFGVNAIVTDRPTEAYNVVCNNKSGGHYPRKQITGQWDFNNSLNATIGSQLVVLSESATPPSVTYGKASSFSLPLINNTDVTVAKIPALRIGNSLRFFSNIFPDGTPNFQNIDNTYTLIFDILKPSNDLFYSALYQTKYDNSDDADLFIYNSNNSVGNAGDYSGSFNDNEWNRFVFVYNLPKNKLEKYINGTLVGTTIYPNSINGLYALNNNNSDDLQGANFFSDNDGETSIIYASSIQLRNYAMTPSEISFLGNVKATKISDSIFNESKRPVFTVQPSDTTIFIDANAAFTVDATDTVNYRWQMNRGNGWVFVDGLQFEGVASNKLTLTTMSEEWNGTKFRCIAESELTTISKEVTLSVVVDNTPVKTDLINNVNIYPNPSSGKFVVQLSNEIATCDLTILTLQGAKVFEHQAISSGETFELNVPAGTYVVQLKTNNNIAYKKLIINK